jgi:hypothetical protein
LSIAMYRVTASSVFTMNGECMALPGSAAPVQSRSATEISNVDLSDDTPTGVPTIETQLRPGFSAGDGLSQLCWSASEVANVVSEPGQRSTRSPSSLVTTGELSAARPLSVESHHGGENSAG